jgi:hypothetical protein
MDISELYAYLAILFYMGLHIENDTRLYWSRKEGDPIHIAVHRAMGENRWHAIHRAFSISDPTIPNQKTTVFQRVEPLNSQIWETSHRYWIPGQDVAVDECMEWFSGRSSDIVTIPSKPISTGYKVWAIA